MAPDREHGVFWGLTRLPADPVPADRPAGSILGALVFGALGWVLERAASPSWWATIRRVELCCWSL
jgi:hypothetical protein